MQEDNEYYLFYVINDSSLKEKLMGFIYDCIQEMEERLDLQKTKKSIEETVENEEFDKEIAKGNTNWNLIEAFERSMRTQYLIDNYKRLINTLINIYKTFQRTYIIPVSLIQNTLLIGVKSIMPHRTIELETFINNLKDYKGMGEINDDILVFLPDGMERKENNLRHIEIHEIKDNIMANLNLI